MKERAPTYQEVLAAARLAAQEIEQEWPLWKRALSTPERPERSDGRGDTEPTRDCAPPKTAV